jgi:hypothetical protein
VTGDPDLHRVVIELHRGDGPMSGRFLAEGEDQPEPFSGWLELLALLETAHRPAETAADPQQQEDNQ